MIGVFGAAGFLGRNVVLDLRSRGLQVRAVSRRFDDPAALLEAGAQVVQADLADSPAISAALAGVSHVIQLVSESGPGNGNSRLIQDLETSVLPQVRFLELCQQAGIHRVVFASSGGTVYGRPLSVPIQEDHPTRPLSSYGLTKLIVENYLALFTEGYGLNHVILRISNPYGPGQRFRNGQGLIANVIAHARDGTPVPVYGDGVAERDYIYVGDVCAAFHAALFRPEAVRQTVNIGSGIGRSVLEVLDAVEEMLGHPLARSHIPMRGTDVARSVLSIDRAATVLGWAPMTSFTDGLQRTLAFAGLLGEDPAALAATEAPPTP